MKEVVETLSILRSNLKKKIYGQDELVDDLILALVADGHVLLEGLPGTAKTRAVKSLAKSLEVEMGRVQFTPDLLPSDLTGYEVLDNETHKMRFNQGPIFKNLVLADEINRAPPKVQSALLEAMEERHVTIGKTSYSLPELFVVMATQNPIEQEGTYPLPEAQLDRFLMRIIINYPDADTEKDILMLVRGEEGSKTEEIQKVDSGHILKARTILTDIHVSEAIDNYIVNLVMTSRNPQKYTDSSLKDWIRIGLSSRATIAIDKCARGRALIAGKDYVDPDDVRSVLHQTMGHRMILSYKAAADSVGAKEVVDEIVRVTPVE